MTGIFQTGFTNRTMFALMALCFAAACSSTTSSTSSTTKLVKSWRDPTATISSSQIDKILFIALVKDEPYRIMMEGQLVALSKGKGIPSNTLVKGNALTENNRAAFDQTIKSEGVDLVVLIRLKDVKEEPRYVPNTEMHGGVGGLGGGYWGAYYYAAPIYSTPGFYTSDKHYLVETNVYSVADNKLLWSGITDSMNPSYTTTERIARAVVESMKNEGFLLN